MGNDPYRVTPAQLIHVRFPAFAWEPCAVMGLESAGDCRPAPGLKPQSRACWVGLLIRGLARSVCVPSMLYAMDQDHLGGVDDLVDDPVVPSPSREQSFELSQ